MKTNLLLITICFLLVIHTNLSAQFSGGSGTESAPYLITSKADMEKLADSVKLHYYDSSYKISINWSKNKYFKLMNDITEPITTGIAVNIDRRRSHQNFQGDFNGNNKKITLAINEYFNLMGLFGGIYEAKIYNLTVDGYVNGYYPCGGICGYAKRSSISNCVNYANIAGDLFLRGGICGWMDFSNDTNNISNCINHGDISGEEGIGGIAGCVTPDTTSTNEQANIYNCINTGNVFGVYTVGGISGHSHEGIKISNCLNTGTIRGDTHVGGITGGNERFFTEEKTGNISNSINSGLVVGKSIVGGIIGRCFVGTVKDCTNTGIISGNTNVGCIVGTNEDGKVENCHFDKQMCSH
jgi:hypothetical protein